MPISQGLYRTVHVAQWRTLELGEAIEFAGPCVLAMDGDRERRLRAGQTARLRVVRSGPHVIDAERVLRLASERGLFLDRPPWHDAYDRS